MQRLLPPVLTLALAATALLATLVVPGGDLLGSRVRWIGLPFAAAGLAMAVAGSRQFERVGTNIKTFDRPDVLVDAGLFSITRNPMYLGFTLALTGWALILDHPVSLVAPVGFFIAADRWYIPFEEERMTETFGPEYENYRRTVRRWIGRR